MAMHKKLQVFVSSTFTDLRDERQAAVAAILKAGHIPAGMELFAAGSEEQLVVIRRWIDESDIFVLLLGRRYGSIEPKTELSYTHLEYDYAVKLGKPLFAVVLTDAAANAKVSAKHNALKVEEVYEQAHPQKFKDFSKLVHEKMCSFADDLKDIRLHVGENLRDLERRHSFSGWVPGDSIASQGEALAAAVRQNEKLEAELRDLRTAAERAQSRSQATTYDGLTYEEVLGILVSQKTKVLPQPGEALVEMPLLGAFIILEEFWVRGVTNKASESDVVSHLFFHVAPRLVSLGLLERGKVPVTVHWQRFALSKNGQRFLSEYKRREVASGPANQPPTDAPGAAQTLGSTQSTVVTTPAVGGMPAGATVVTNKDIANPRPAKRPRASRKSSR